MWGYLIFHITTLWQGHISMQLTSLSIHFNSNRIAWVLILPALFTLLLVCRPRKADRVIKWASNRFKDTHLTWSVYPPPPPSSPLPWLFTFQTPPLTPLLGWRGSSPLEPANYRVLSSAWLSPKSRGTFLQLGDLQIFGVHFLSQQDRIKEKNT